MYKVMINSKKVIGDKDSKDLDCVCSFTTLDAAELYVSKYPRLGLIVEDITKEYDDFVENMKYDNPGINYDDLIDNDDSINPDIPRKPSTSVNISVLNNGLTTYFDKLEISFNMDFITYLSYRDLYVSSFDNTKYDLSFGYLYKDSIVFHLEDKRCF